MSDASGVLRRAVNDYGGRSWIRDFAALHRSVLRWAPCSAVPAGTSDPILRIDVDSHRRQLSAMLDVIAEEPRGSFTAFFRRSTADPRLMRRVQAAGGEVGYHYEELSDLMRSHPRREAEALLATARDRHRTHLTELRRRADAPIQVAAAHGDWVNRRRRVSNERIHEDPSFSEAVGIIAETYQAGYLGRLGGHLTDGWERPAITPERLGAALEQANGAGGGPVQVLVHPRHWGSDPAASAWQDVSRLAQGLIYRAKGGSGS